MTEIHAAPTYSAFGLLWRSPDLPLRELPLGGPACAEAAVIELGDETSLSWPDLPPGPHDTDSLRMGPADLRFTVQGTGRFRITEGKRIAWQRQEEGVSDSALCTYVLGAAMSAVLIQRGLLVMHGNALARDGKAIVCLGPSGAGKSTLAYALMRQGWRLLADDLVAISADGRVLPGIPRIKLWPEAARDFGLDPAALPCLHHGLRKVLLSGEAVQPLLEPVELRALYLIQRCPLQAEALPPQPIRAIRSEREAAALLRSQAYHVRFVRGMGREGDVFLATARLQRSVPVATLAIPSGIDRLLDWLESGVAL